MIFLYHLLLLLALITFFPVWLAIATSTPKRRLSVPGRLWLRTGGIPRRAPAADKTRPAATGRRVRIWVHALSLGEMISADPLVRRLRKRHPQARIILTGSTLTGVETARQRLSAEVDHIHWFPYDLIFCLRRAAARIDPDLVVIVETDLWPGFLSELQRKQIPALLVNARLSDKSFAGYGRAGALIRPLVRSFRAVCVQSAADARRFADLAGGGANVRLSGNIKFDQPGPGAPAFSRQDLGLPETAPVWVAGSTHPGEEALLLRVFQRLRECLPDLRMIIVPRQPDRAAEIASLFGESGLAAPLLAQVESGGAARTAPGPDVVVVDRVGILAGLYALGQAAFVGGSLTPFGGHNPLEPALAGVPVCFGPHMTDFRDVAARLVESGGGAAADADGLVPLLSDWFSRPDEAKRRGEAARRIIRENRGATERILNEISRFI